MTLERNSHTHTNQTTCSWSVKVFLARLASFGRLGPISDPYINFHISWNGSSMAKLGGVHYIDLLK